MSGYATHRTCPCRTGLLVVAAAAAVLAVASSARATTYFWEWASGNGNWNTSSRWNPDGHPRADDGAWVVNGGASDVTVYYYSDYPAEELSEVWVYAVGAGDMLLFASSGDALNAKFLAVGFAGPGAVDQRAGAFTFSSGVVLGNGNPGDYSTRGGSLTTPTLEVGFSDVGRFTHSGGAAVEVTDALTVGDPTGNSYYDIDGGTLTAATLAVGILDVLDHSAPGTFNQTGGTVDIGADLIVGDEVAGPEHVEGWYTLTNAGATLNVSGTTCVGDEGLGHFDHTAGTHTTADLCIGREATGEGYYDLSGSGTLDVTGTATVGLAGEAEFQQSGGTTEIDDALRVAWGAGSDGLYRITSGSLTVHDNEWVGGLGTGNVYQSSCTHTVEGALALAAVYSVGTGAAGTADFDLAGGTLTTDFTSIGVHGTATMDHTGGDHHVLNDLSIGGPSVPAAGQPIGTGTYNLLGVGELQVDGIAMVGRTGIGLVDQDGGTATFGTDLYLGYERYPAGVGQGTYELSGTADCIVDGVLYVGYKGVGTFTQTGGAATATGGVRIGSQADGQGTLNLSGGTLLSDTFAYVGQSGQAAVNHSGGTFTVMGALYGARFAGSDADYTLSGTGVLDVRADEYIGRGARCDFVQSGGTHDVDGSLYFAWSSGLWGTYDLSGGDLHVHANETLGFNGIATFTQSDGDHHVDGNLELGHAGASVGAYTMTDGTAGVDGTMTIRQGSWMDMQGGSFGASHLVNHGAFQQVGGQFIGLTVQHDSLTYLKVDGAATAMWVDEITNDADFRLYDGTVRGRAALQGLFTNNDTFRMYGGTFEDRLVNHGLFHYEGGTFGGFLEHRGLFTRTGDFTAGDGIENYATLTVSPGYGIGADGAGLENHGSVIMAGGILSGDADAVNHGTLGGYGFITGTGNLVNHGSLVVQGGCLNVSKAGFANEADLVMADAAAQLTGTKVENSGTLSGVGRIESDVDNLGTIEPVGGTLVLAGALNHKTDGTTSVSTGNRLHVPNGFGSSYGFVSLAGGILETTYLTNYGHVAGYGTLRVTALSNYEDVTFSGGSATIEGDITNQSSGEIEVKYQPAVFTGDVANWGDFKVTDTTVTFLGAYDEHGTYTSDPASTYFKDVSVSTKGYFIGGTGDRFFVRGDFLSESTNAADWNTAQADLIFQAGADDEHTFSVTSAVGGGWTDNFAWGGVTLQAGQTVALADDATPGGSLYALAVTLEAETRLEASGLTVVTRGLTAGAGPAHVAVGVVLEDALQIDAAELGTLVLEELLDNSLGKTITKVGDGTLVIDGPQEHGSGACFDILGGTVDMNTDASGTGLMDDADLSISVADAVLNFGCDQYLDTLSISGDGLVRLTGANVVVLKRLVMDGVDLGATTLTPEPATLSLLALGGLGLLAGRRRRRF